MSVEIKIDNLRKVDLGNATKAFADIQYGDLVIKGYRVVQGNEGDLFVSRPSDPGEDENGETAWFPKVKSKNKRTQELIDEAILEKYKE